ncbi:MAG: DUF1800 domain-containing protein [Anaerolineae bacterium]|jgi:hypothetical protein|nr:DUF1800 domain-containing protein [Anaerolineae bacterium]
MAVSRRNFLQLSAWVGVGAGVAWSGLRVPITHAQGVGSPERHVLNRLTWGPNPDDYARIQELGIEGYIDWQLDAENIPDEAIDQFIGGRRILTMTYDEIGEIAVSQYAQVLYTMLWARIYRAAYSERQLYELMVEFWTDHFNIPIGDLLSEKIVDDREVIRKHALGYFRDLLYASARSAAMLYYLDNATSSAEHPNENYAREIMELHTLGVDGGYTEDDVTEVARAFTGWTVESGFVDGFHFNRDQHDSEPKRVLGYDLPAGRGIEDGLDVINILAHHPSTARFVSYKLCRRFVSDRPAESLIESTTQVFIDTDGNIREVMRHILKSAEFMAAEGQKFRRPLDFVVAIMRTFKPHLQFGNLEPVLTMLEPLGQLPFFWHPPNGYPDAAGAWINTNGLLHRWNTALTMALAGDGYVDGASFNVAAVVPMPNTVGELVDLATERVIGGGIAPEDRDQLIAFVSRNADPNEVITDDLYYTKLPTLLGLLMASPYFQWR